MVVELFMCHKSFSFSFSFSFFFFFCKGGRDGGRRGGVVQVCLLLYGNSSFDVVIISMYLLFWPVVLSGHVRELTV